MCGILAQADGDPMLTEFAALKHRQMRELATRLQIEVPPEAETFFQAAEAGDWDSITNSFARFQLYPEPATDKAFPGLTNALFVPVHETWGAYVESSTWDWALLQKFADGVLQSIPDGSIYFGGTGAGRFFITAFRDAANSPDIFVLTTKLTSTFYLDYLQLAFRNRIWVPSQQDLNLAFQQYVDDTRAGRTPAGTEGSPQGIMMLDGMLTRRIFDENKGKHDFYVEESFVIPWMYPYLEPHGLIMKLNKQPTELDPAVIARDREYWDALSRELLADPRFLHNKAAREIFSKLRNAIGGLYLSRRNYPEMEYAFRQAIDLYPSSYEANFRLADAFMQESKFDKAAALIETFAAEVPDDEKIRDYLDQIRNTGKGVK